MRILIAYGSSYGSTARISERIADRMRRFGATVIASDVSRVEHDLEVETFDAILVGGRVHGNRYPRRVIRFLRRHLDALRSRPSGLFSVSLLQFSQDAAARAQTESLPWNTAQRFGWAPDMTTVIGGALPWSRYGFLGRTVMKAIWKRVFTEPLDTSKDQVFTDWPSVDRFADEFLKMAVDRVVGGEVSLVEPPAHASLH